MKINVDLAVATTTPLKDSNRANSQESSNFLDVLAQAVATDKATDTPAADAIAGIALVEQTDTSLPPLWSEIKGLLDCLEEYSQKLGNIEFTLKDLEPLVQDLEGKLDKIRPEVNSASEDPLQDIAQQVLTQAQVEVIKFRRGDYV
jgi:archaellum component FlaC